MSCGARLMRSASILILSLEGGSVYNLTNRESNWDFTGIIAAALPAISLKRGLRLVFPSLKRTTTERATKMKYTNLLAKMLLMMTMPVLHAQTCTPPIARPVAVKGITDIYVDASTGQYIGPKEFRTHDQVRLVIENKNPFLYKYTVKENVKVIAEDDLKLFLSAVGLPAIDTTQLQTAAEKAAPANAGQLKIALANPSNPVTKLIAADTLARNLSGDIGEKFAKIKKDWDAATAILKKDGQKPAELKKAIESLLLGLESLEKKPNLDDLDKAIKELNSAAIVVEWFASDHNSTEYALAHIALTDILPARKKELKGYQDAAATWTDSKETVAAVCGDPEAFVSTTMLNQDSDPRTNELTVEKTTLDKANAKTTTLASVKLQFGSARFTLSGGLVGSPLGHTQYQIAQGFVRNRDGSIAKDTKVENGVTVPIPNTEKIGSIIGAKEDSDSSLLPMVLLHANLHDFVHFHSSVGFHLSAGVTAKNDNQGTAVEYLFGPSVSFLEKHLFLTGGAYGAKQQVLAGDLFLGAPADKLTADGLATKRLRWGVGFAISYKLR